MFNAAIISCVFLHHAYAEGCDPMPKDYAAELLMWKTVHNVSRENIGREHILAEILNEKSDDRFLAYLQTLYTFYIVEDSHNQEIFSLIGEIISKSRSRALPRRRFYDFLRELLSFSNNRHRSGVLLVQMIENLKTGAGPNINKAELESLYTQAFANDNPGVIQAMLDCHIISGKDGIDVLQRLFLTHGVIHTDAYVAKERCDLAKRQSDSPRLQILPGRMHMVERKNGIQIADLLKSHHYRFMNPGRYLLFLEKTELIPGYGTRFRLQSGAEALFKHIADMGSESA